MVSRSDVDDASTVDDRRAHERRHHRRLDMLNTDVDDDRCSVSEYIAMLDRADCDEHILESAAARVRRGEPVSRGRRRTHIHRAARARHRAEG